MRDDLLTMLSGDSSAEGLRDHASLKAVAATFIAIATVVAATLVFPEGEAGGATLAKQGAAAQVAMVPERAP